ncbi:MAG: class I SAM-dependent methyltransferase [Actinomycetota bacterium]|nr:class I SAM-dependent methyltransferase [Actinomycetota bacterium]
MTSTVDTANAAQSYDAVAPFYDDFTAHHDYELWTGAILAAARRHGLSGKRLLDVGCGTGKSFLPFVGQGWSVVACDLSLEMLARAAEKVSAEDVALHQADVRALPDLGPCDLVLALDDVLNHVEGDDLVVALDGLRRNLSPNGVLVFDCNTELTYRSFFAATEDCDLPDGVAVWRGRVDSALWRPGQEAVADLEAFRRTPAGDWQQHATVRQHHHPPASVVSALAVAGLELLGLYGHGFDAQLVQPLDEQEHTKALYIARDQRAER